jgi:hypothetical protein
MEFFIKFLGGGMLGLSFGKLDLRVRNTVTVPWSGLRQKGVMGGGWGSKVVILTGF